MKVIGRQELSRCAQENREARPYLTAWLFEVEASQWQHVDEVRRLFPSVEVANDTQLWFLLCQQRYRIEAQVSYGLGILLVQRVTIMAKALILFDGEVN